MNKFIIIVFLLIASFKLVNAAELTVKLRDGTFVVRQLDVNTQKINFTIGESRDMSINDPRNIVEIAGLENFPKLRELWFWAVPFISDFNFLRRLDTLEVLVFQDIRFNNIDFIYDLVSLRKLIFQGCRVNKTIDASRLPNLEYFEFTNSQLTEFPLRVVERRNISTINIAFNNIRDISSIENMEILIIAHRNPIRITGNQNIITYDGSSFFYAVPKRYRRFVR